MKVLCYYLIESYEYIVREVGSTFFFLLKNKSAKYYFYIIVGSNQDIMFRNIILSTAVKIKFVFFVKKKKRKCNAFMSKYLFSHLYMYFKFHFRRRSFYRTPIKHNLITEHKIEYSI